jgi:FMN phosphatase YigB (HAD superfamily)
MKTMNPPQAVVFDLGKVLLDFDYRKAARSLAVRSRLPVDAIHRFINQSPLLFRYETGLLSREKFYEEFCAETGFAGGPEEFGECFGDIFEPIPPMIELHAALRKRNLPAYIFSNTNELAILHVKKRYPFFANFDGYIFSYEHGAMKPHAKLYEVVERETGRRGGQILYLDDRPENIAAGEARGWQVILHETPEKTAAALQRMGLVGGGGR